MSAVALAVDADVEVGLVLSDNELEASPVFGVAGTGASVEGRTSVGVVVGVFDGRLWFRHR